MDTETRTDLTTPRGQPVTLLVRPGTSDLSLAGAFFHLWGVHEDEYHLAELHVDGVFVDIGAHIGLVTIAVLLDNPTATAICVEPLAENCELITANAEVNGLTERVTVIQAAVAAGDTADVAYNYVDADDSTTYFHDNRFIGAMSEQAPTHQSVVTVPTITLARLVDMAGGEIAAMKLDCEGCEWRLLREPAVADVRIIFGEWHGHAIGGAPGNPALTELLGATHAVEILRDLGGTGDFRAVRR